ncbi:MAG: DUF47 family protein [Alphaproteobacteria bacterium]|nr:DUF47 family protein [Alphaproteobacteria bacterium]
MSRNISRFSLFGKTRSLENKIDTFLDKVIESTLIFDQLFQGYLSSGIDNKFIELMKQLDEIESQGDVLRRVIETDLYEQNLIPDIRADVLSLVEDMDDILNTYYVNTFKISIEKPQISDEYIEDYKELNNQTSICVEHAVKAARAFFRDISSVRDHNHKVMFYETQADKVSTRIKISVFDSKLSLQNKMHLRDFVDYIDSIADMAEDIADKLAIFTIKRRI